MRQRSLCALEPCFLVHVPCARDVPCRQPARTRRQSHGVVALVAECAVDRVTPFVGIGRVEEECGIAVIGLLLLAFFEDEVIVERNLSCVVLQTPAAEPRRFAVDLVGLHTRVCIDDMRVVDSLAVSGRKAEVVGEHPVVGPLIDTAGGQYAHGFGIDVVRVLVEKRVVVPDRRRAHGPVCLGLIRIVADVVFLRGPRITHRSQSRGFETLESLPFQLALELHVSHVQVDVVVFHLGQDVERSIIAHIEFIGIEHARSVQRIRIGIDVEVAFHLAGHVVGRGAESPGSFLLAVRPVGDHIE